MIKSHITTIQTNKKQKQKRNEQLYEKGMMIT